MSEIVDIKPPEITTGEIRDVTFGVAKKVLHELIDAASDLGGDAQPAAWRPRVIGRMQTDHPMVPPAQLEKCVRDIESMWGTFYELVAEQRARRR